MNTRLVSLVIGAAVIVGVAGVMLTRNNSGAEVKRGLFLPSLKSEVGSVRRIEIHRGDQSTTLERSGEEWSIASSGGYPARVESVRSIMTGLVGLEIDEPLTAKRERHGELGLAWPDTSKSATLIRLLGEGDTVLHEIVLGEERFQPKSQYVRRLAEDQTYRCRGGASIEAETRSYVDPQIVALSDAQIDSIAYDGLIITREEKDGVPSWTSDLAPDRALAPDAPDLWPEEQRKAAVQALPTWIGRLDFEDVRLRERPDAVWTADPALSVIYFGKEATVTLEGMREGDDVWMRFSAAPTAAATPAPPKTDEASSEAKAEPAEGTPAQPDAPTFDWAAWNTRMTRWEFKLPDWKVSALTRIRETKPVSSPTPAEGATP